MYNFLCKVKDNLTGVFVLLGVIFGLNGFHEPITGPRRERTGLD